MSEVMEEFFCNSINRSKLMITIIVPRGFIQKLLASHLGKKLTVFMKISFIAMFTKPAI
jgi:hypothetical protein